MDTIKPKHHRRTIRLQNYDYSQEGMYFVTICTEKKKCLFGEINNGDMVLNNKGKMVKKWWLELTTKYPNINLDEFIIMPNHLHGVIAINEQTFVSNLKNIPKNVGADLCVCPINKGEHTGSPLRKITISEIIQWFKSMSTDEYIAKVKIGQWPRFDKRVWQRNYYEHVIRNERDYLEIQEYIQNNPLKWDLDEDNPGKNYLHFNLGKSNLIL